jgi:hypothetical protein
VKIPKKDNNDNKKKSRTKVQRKKRVKTGQTIRREKRIKRKRIKERT